MNSHTNNSFQQVFWLQKSVFPDNHDSEMGAILQTVKHHQCYTISFYPFTIVVEYHKELSM